jgi:hypothetical protein
MNDMGKTFAPLCCPNHNADCNRGPPKTCNKQCAQLFVPFFDKCANAIIKAGMDNNGELAAFADKCAGVRLPALRYTLPQYMDLHACSYRADIAPPPL